MSLQDIPFIYDLIRPYFPKKEFLTTPMKQEVERCTLAIETALTGKTVAMVCSGDPGVYGMAGLILELSQSYPNPAEIKVIGGITAACSGAAVLGAPLMHDFAVISLSDLLTPGSEIEARLRCAAQGDFVICLYNPSSKKRQDYLQKACRHPAGIQNGGYRMRLGKKHWSRRRNRRSSLSGGIAEHFGGYVHHRIYW